MSTNISNIRGRMSNAGLRVWMAILFLAALVFIVNFIKLAQRIFFRYRRSEERAIGVFQRASRLVGKT